ncbi:MAG: PD-(D/E)XK nuclease family protein, partial [Treponema sp.]|nr:PD-(D/E)XK nuclease family protein [Treponema sp.]
MNNDIFEFIKNFTAKKKKNASLLQYNLNLIDELHANENAHTRILLKLLDYESNQKKVILEEFLNLLNEKLVNQKIPILDDYRITGQFEFIDGYIWSDSKKVAIIIENKINWACDQNEQIQRYIETAKQYGIDEKNIFVVYLTDNGKKKADDCSFTDYAKKMLDWKDPENQGRYIESNYLNDILPFLYEIFDKLSFSKENVLKAAIFQYIDYLEGRFGMRKNEKEYNMAMNSDILKILNLDENLSKKEKFDKIVELQRELWNTLDNVKNEVYPDRPEVRLKDYYEYFEDKKDPFEN